MRAKINFIEGKGASKMILPWYLFVPAYYFQSAIYLIFGVDNTRFIKCVLKCIPVITLMLQMVALLVSQKVVSTESKVNEPIMVAVLVEEETASTTTSKLNELYRIKLFVVGLAFSAFGDGCLVFHEVFLAGVIGFGISLCLYINVLGFMESIFKITHEGLMYGLGIFVMSSIILLIFNSYTHSTDTPQPGKTIVTVLIILYYSILSVLLWSGFLLMLRHPDIAVGVCAVFGTTMFFISDMLIIASAIWKVWLLQGRVLVMMSYYTALLFLSFSLYISLDSRPVK